MKSWIYNYKGRQVYLFIIKIWLTQKYQICRGPINQSICFWKGNCYNFSHMIFFTVNFSGIGGILRLKLTNLIKRPTFSAASFSLARSLRRSLISAFKSSLFLSNSFTFSLRTLAVPPAAPPVSGPYFYKFNKQTFRLLVLDSRILVS